MSSRPNDLGVGFRFAVFAVLLTLPIFRLLVRDTYGFLNLEVAVITAVVAAISTALAAAARSRLVFGALVMTLILVLSAGTVQHEFIPQIRFRWILPALAAGVGTAMTLMGKRFYVAMLVFVVSSLGVDVVQTALRPSPAPRPQSLAKHPELRHVLHLIFDEHIGVRGLPDDVPECRHARTELLEVLNRYNLTTYPNAFSNYSFTWDSIPSILNGALLDRSGSYRNDDPSRPIVLTNRLFDQYLARGFAIRSYQSDFIDYASPNYPDIVTQTYRGDNLAPLGRAPVSWTTRLRAILIASFRSNQLVWGLYERFRPPGFELKQLIVWPLNVSEWWPARILGDMYAAEKNTVFFGHLLIPHYPYVYGPDGEVKGAEAWGEDHNLVRYDRQSYTTAYKRYAEQVRFTTRQLDSVFQTIEAMGLLDSMTIVVHGDHGSRIRRLDERERAYREKLLAPETDVLEFSRYDYLGKPEFRDLLNRFSALLAIKTPGAVNPRVIEEKGSVMSLLWSSDVLSEDLNVDPSDANSVYLFDAEGLPRKIDILKIWEEKDTESP